MESDELDVTAISAGEFSLPSNNYENRPNTYQDNNNNSNNNVNVFKDNNQNGNGSGEAEQGTFEL